MNDRERTRFSALIQQRLATLAAENRLGQEAQAVVQLDQQSVGRLSLDPSVSKCINCASG